MSAGIITGLLGTGIGAALAEQAYSDIGGIGRDIRDAFSGKVKDPVTGLYSGGLADTLSENLEFQPYTVTTGSGGQFGMSVDPETGQRTFASTLSSPTEQALQDNQFTRAEAFFKSAAQDRSDREKDIYDQIRLVMQPEEERAQLALEERLVNQGRSGVRTGMFGGTPEQFALNLAREEAKNKAMLAAIELAREEQESEARLGTGLLAAGYVPQAQLTSSVAPGMTAAERARQALSEQQRAYGETYATGLQGLLSAGLGQADLAGTLGSTIAQTSLSGLLSGLFGP